MKTSTQKDRGRQEYQQCLTILCASRSTASNCWIPFWPLLDVILC